MNKFSPKILAKAWPHKYLWMSFFVLKIVWHSNWKLKLWNFSSTIIKNKVRNELTTKNKKYSIQINVSVTINGTNVFLFSFRMFSIYMNEKKREKHSSTNDWIKMNQMTINDWDTKAFKCSKFNAKKKKIPKARRL